MISLREIDELRGNTERLVDMCTQLARDNMVLLDRLESMRSASARECPYSVHVSRIPDDIDKTELIKELERDYGQVRSFKRGKFWINIQFETADSKRRCLDDKKQLFERLGIAVQPHIKKN